MEKRPARTSMPKNRRASLNVNVSADKGEIQRKRPRGQQDAPGGCAPIVVCPEFLASIFMVVPRLLRF